MTKQPMTEVEGLPKGYKALAYRHGIRGELGFEKYVFVIDKDVTDYPLIIVEKIQRRRIVLEETDLQKNSNHPQVINTSIGAIGIYHDYEMREVKETDIPEPKLSLSVSEVKTIFGCDFALLVKIEKFIKENS
jgi:hypothetical protein